MSDLTAKTLHHEWAEQVIADAFRQGAKAAHWHLRREPMSEEDYARLLSDIGDVHTRWLEEATQVAVNNALRVESAVDGLAEELEG